MRAREAVGSPPARVPVRGLTDSGNAGPFAMRTLPRADLPSQYGSGRASGSIPFFHENRVLIPSPAVAQLAAFEAGDGDDALQPPPQCRRAAAGAHHMAARPTPCVMLPVASRAGRRMVDSVVPAHQRLEQSRSRRGAIAAGPIEPFRLSRSSQDDRGGATRRREPSDAQLSVRHTHPDKANNEEGNADQRPATRGKPDCDH